MIPTKAERDRLRKEYPKDAAPFCAIIIALLNALDEQEQELCQQEASKNHAS